MTGGAALTWRSSGRTDVGRVRQVNEDAILERPEIGLWVVADGMGGHEAGDVASQTIIGAMRQVAAPQSVDHGAAQVRDLLQKANRWIREEAARRGAQAMMGSTVVALVAHGGGFICLWAGDSRAYLLRGGALSQITRDHSAVEDLIASGSLRREDAADHPHANVITRAVGAQDHLDLDEIGYELGHGDRIVLCSDGLNKEVTDAEIGAVVAGNGCADAVALLIETALSRGGRDNVTVAIVEFDAAPAPDQTYVLGT